MPNCDKFSAAPIASASIGAGNSRISVRCHKIEAEVLRRQWVFCQYMYQLVPPYACYLRFIGSAR